MFSEKIKVAVLISGRGSNLKALIEASKDSDFPAVISLVISNKQDAGGLKIATENNIKTLTIDHKLFKSRQDFDNEVTQAIAQNSCQIVCLAGFMRILSQSFVDRWRSRLINIHPSLLPAFKGADAVGDALKYGVKYSGCTVHYVEKEVDSGKIIAQAVVVVEDNDNKASLAARILESEHLIYPKALKQVCIDLKK